MSDIVVQATIGGTRIEWLPGPDGIKWVLITAEAAPPSPGARLCYTTTMNPRWACSVLTMTT